MNKDSLVIGIEEMYRNHPIPNLPNFKIVPWADQDTIQSADAVSYTHLTLPTILLV